MGVLHDNHYALSAFRSLESGDNRNIRGWMTLMLHEAKELEILMSNYQHNVERIWNLRANDIFIRWKDEKGDFGVLQEALRAVNPESLLDIGYGYGRLAPLYEKVPFAVGMDVSERMLELYKLQSDRRNKIKTALGDIRCMPFPDASFSCLVSVRTLNHIHTDDLTKAEQEINRVCRDTVIVLESDVKVPNAPYEFEHNYDRFLMHSFSQTKKALGEDVYLRIYIRSRTR